MLGADEKAEMTQFHVVNSNAKSVPTDLALKLLRARAEGDQSVMDKLIQTGNQWKIYAQKTTENIAERSPIWKGRIKMPNEPTADTTIGSASMVRSLEGLFRHTAIFSGIQDEQKVQIIDAYWQGIKSVLQEPFDNPKKYGIQKGVGVRVLHGILPTVIEHVRSKGNSVFSKDAYAEILRNVLMKIEGENALGESVSGEIFWKTGKEGAIGGFSSEAGMGRLIDRMKTLLPPLEVA